MNEQLDGSAAAWDRLQQGRKAEGWATDSLTQHTCIITVRSRVRLPFVLGGVPHQAQPAVSLMLTGYGATQWAVV